MSARDLKSDIIHLLEQTEDEELLLILLSLLQKSLGIEPVDAIGYDANGRPFTVKQLEKEVLAASRRIKSGKFIKHEELKKQIKTW